MPFLINYFCEIFNSINMRELFIVIAVLVNLFLIFYSISKMKEYDFKKRYNKYLLIYFTCLIPIVGFLVVLFLVKKKNNSLN